MSQVSQSYTSAAKLFLCFTYASHSSCIHPLAVGGHKNKLLCDSWPHTGLPEHKRQCHTGGHTAESCSHTFPSGHNPHLAGSQQPHNGQEGCPGGQVGRHTGPGDTQPCTRHDHRKMCAGMDPHIPQRHMPCQGGSHRPSSTRLEMEEHEHQAYWNLLPARATGASNSHWKHLS